MTAINKTAKRKILITAPLSIGLVAVVSYAAANLKSVATASNTRPTVATTTAAANEAAAKASASASATLLGGVRPAAPPAPPGATGRQKLGINVGAAAYWSGERDFMNLAMGDNWRRSVGGRWTGLFDANRIDPATGTPKSLQAGEAAVVVLTPPLPRPQPYTIRCTWAGDGKVTIGNVAAKSTGTRQLEFTLNVPSFHQNPRAWLNIEQTVPANPVRNVDCRETDASRTALFAPEFLDSLRPFGVIRFLDWQKINANKGGVWAKRTQPSASTHGVDEGVAIEHIVALAKELRSDAWIHIPYNANEEYITKMAQLVRANLPASQKVYVELSNEVWNYGFPVANQAQSEGLAQNLSPAPFKALMYRYSDKVRFAMNIWQRVFADRPGQLVRILGTQSANPWTAEQMLLWRDTPKFVDAVATAPYFGYNTSSTPNTPLPTLDQMFLLLGQRADSILATSQQTSAIARRFGKRHVAYEAGQHMLTPNNLPYLQQANRHQKMYQLYDRYLRKWRSEQNDLMVLFNATSPVSQYGAWGIREFGGQPLAETPKRRAALEAAVRS